jgi:hypothetical protein
MLEEFRVRVKQSSLHEREAASLMGALAALREESFTTALTQFVERLNSPPEIKGRPLKKFISDCIKARNRIAHNAEIESSLNLSELSSGLREIVLTLIWTFNGIPGISVDVPASTVSIQQGELSIRVL